jgi:hypothetical protein
MPLFADLFHGIIANVNSLSPSTFLCACLQWPDVILRYRYHRLTENVKRAGKIRNLISSGVSACENTGSAGHMKEAAKQYSDVSYM